MNDGPHVRPGKFKGSTYGYALVNGIVFPSVSEAEVYCAAAGLDPNEHILSGDLDVLKQCKAIALTSVPVLQNLLRILDADQKELDGRVSLISQEYEEQRQSPRMSLCIESSLNRLMEAGAKASAHRECRKKVFSYILTLESVIRL